MRIKITLSPIGNKGIILPTNYNYLLQSFIYRNLSQRVAKFLHNEGFIYEKRVFKMFVFSRIFGKKEYRRDEKMLYFSENCSFYLSSPYIEMLEKLAESIIRTPEVRLNKQRLYISSIEVMRRKIFPERFIIKALSPITIHSTLYTKKGRRKTYYYNPFEKEFNDLINKNIKKKYEAFYGHSTNGDIEVNPFKVNSSSEKIVKYKSFIIKGWLGLYEISGDPELIAFSYYTGLGNRNPQGFGMWEEYKGYNK